MRLVMVGVTAPSHIYPSLGVIRELVARGHDVTYVVGDRHAGLVPGHVGYASLLPDSDTAWPDDPGEAMQLFLDEEITALPHVLALDPPDAVLYDIGGYAGRVAAHRWGVPAIQLSPTYVAWEGYEDDMAEFVATLKASESGARYFAGMRSWLDENGMSHRRRLVPRPPGAGRRADPARVAAERRSRRPALRVHRPVHRRVADDGLDAGWRRDRSRTSRSGPRTRTTSRSTARAWRRLAGYRLVIATGKVDPAELGVGARTQPQLDVLAHADVFVTHAGMGSASESLWFGVPTVAIPQAVDQFTNAAQLEAAGAGVHLPAEQVTVESLRDAVARAVAQAPRARELQEEVRRSGGIAATADTVERLVGV